MSESDETMSSREIAEAAALPFVGLDRMLDAMVRARTIWCTPAGRYGVAPAKRPGPLEAAVLDAAGIEPGEGA